MENLLIHSNNFNHPEDIIIYSSSVYFVRLILSIVNYITFIIVLFNFRLNSFISFNHINQRLN
jgi:hypothetical protein